MTEQIFARSAPGRRPHHLLGRADVAELQALHGGRPTRRQPARLRRGGDGDLRPGRAAGRGRARRRPVFALMVVDDRLAEITKLTPVPVGRIELPWGQRYPADSTRRSTGCTRPTRCRDGAGIGSGRGHGCSTSVGRPGSSGSGSASSTGRRRGRSARALEPDRWLAADLRFERDRGWSGPAAAATIRGRSSSTGSRSSCERPRPARSACSPSTPRCCRGCASGSASACGGGRAGRCSTSSPTRDSRRSPSPRPGAAVDARRRVAPDRDLGAPQRRAIRPRRPARSAGSSTTRWPSREREVRRGRRYAGVVLDPPSYGHGPAAAATGASRTTCRGLLARRSPACSSPTGSCC